jgi:hypothetical protein
MIQTLTTQQIVDRLLRDEYASWTRAGAEALAKFLEEREQELGEQHEFDPVALRCDLAEYHTALEAAKEFGYDGPESEESALEWLNDSTYVIEFEGGVVVAAF